MGIWTWELGIDLALGFGHWTLIGNWELGIRLPTATNVHDFFISFSLRRKDAKIKLIINS
jgi:hypothetical protein